MKDALYGPLYGNFMVLFVILELDSHSLSFTYMEVNFQKEKGIILMCLCYHVITQICTE